MLGKVLKYDLKSLIKNLIPLYVTIWFRTYDKNTWII